MGDERRVIDYIVLDSSEEQKLAERVADLLPEWQPYGNLVPACNCSSSRPQQVMVRYDKAENWAKHLGDVLWS